jgi:hypothetical protein
MEVIDLIEESRDAPHLLGAATTGRDRPEDAELAERYKWLSYK